MDQEIEKEEMELNKLNSRLKTGELEKLAQSSAKV